MEKYLSSILSSGATRPSGYELSFVIFLNDFREEDARFYFLNERTRVCSGIWGDLSDMMPDTMGIEAEKGDIVFFI